MGSTQQDHRDAERQGARQDDRLDSRRGERHDQPWQAQLREGGYRLTPQRQLVLEAVTRLGHATPDDVAVEISHSLGGVSLSTVYRALEVLEQVGLVTHAHLGHGAPTYHPADRAGHVHLVCRECDGVAEVDMAVAAPLVERLHAEYGFETDIGHFALFGTCRTCAARAHVVPTGRR